MVSKINSCAVIGVEGHIVTVETDYFDSVPDFQIVGLGDTAVKESRERVKAALKNSGIKLPAKSFVANLAPADMKKEGVLYDLPIAIGLAISCKLLRNVNLDDCMFIGELSLNGEIRPVKGILPSVIAARENNITKIFVPEKNKNEACVVKGVEIFPCSKLTEVFEHISGSKLITAFSLADENILNTNNAYPLDFSDVKGQKMAKWALEVACAGGHNVLMSGSPGAGKTMLAKRIPSILPDLDFNEALEITKVHSVAGTLPEKTALVTTRPFRSPHHTVSAPGLAGGGTVPRPGEISLAHNGVLFLDEFPEFHRDALEILRQPMENKTITVSRTKAQATYPCNFMLVAATNPCPCGFYNDPVHQCTCTKSAIDRYHAKMSGPVLDRIDIQINVDPVAFDDLDKAKDGETSAVIRDRVNKAREIQKNRFKGTGIYKNSDMTEAMMEKYCPLSEESKAVLKLAFEKLGLSARSYNRILKVSRTIADLEGSTDIEKDHILKAIRLRRNVAFDE